MSRLSPSVLVIILLVSCLFIYIGPAQNQANQGLVGIILLLIVLIGLFLAFSGGSVAQRESARNMLGTLTGITAVSCAALLGQQALNGNLLGLMCAPVLLAGVYMIFLAMTARIGQHVEEGEVLLIQRRMDHQHIIRPPGLHSPIVPALEVGVAVMPTYNIQTDVEIEMVDTASLHTVDKIMVDTQSRIIQRFPDEGESMPVEMRYEGFLKLPYNYPNRDHIFKEIADRRNMDVMQVRMSADFWIEAIQSQLRRDVEEDLRAIIHDNTFYNPEKRSYGKLAPADISARRAEIAAQLKNRVQEKVQQWGIEVLDIGITQVVLNPDRIKAFYRAITADLEIQTANRLAEQEAKRTIAMADAEAYQRKKLAETELEIQRQRSEIDNAASLQMLQDWMNTIIGDNPDMKPDDLKRLLTVALDEHEKRKAYRDHNLSEHEKSS